MNVYCTTETAFCFLCLTVQPNLYILFQKSRYLWAKDKLTDYLEGNLDANPLVRRTLHEKAKLRTRACWELGEPGRAGTAGDKITGAVCYTQGHSCLHTFSRGEKGKCSFPNLTLVRQPSSAGYHSIILYGQVMALSPFMMFISHHQ